MSMFTNAHNTVIHGGYFTINSNPNRWDLERAVIQVLEQHVACGAFHNSKERYDPPKCLPRTREAVFRELSYWIHVESTHKPILWLYGPAGAGKSAIAQSLADKVKEIGYLLVATFFFNRSSGERNNVERLIPSLAYQIISSLPSSRNFILKAIIETPGLFSLNVKTQMEKLIIEPLRSAGILRAPNTSPMLIILDGIDECQDLRHRTEFIRALTDSFDNPTFPLAFLCTSRPESDIRTAFNDPRTSNISSRLVLNNEYNPDSDIRIFLDHHFAEIRLLHPLKEQIPEDWPYEFDILELVRKSSGQFIYASTAVKHVALRKFNPLRQLETVLRVGSISDTSPFKELDALYRLVLSSVEEDRAKLTRILGMICFPPRADRRPTTAITPAVIDDLLHLDAGETLLLLDSLHSLIEIGGIGDPLKPFHASFGDFLHDRSRSEVYHVDPGLSLADHTLIYFKIIFLKISDQGGMKVFPPHGIKKINPTNELLQFFDMFSWEDALKKTIPQLFLPDICETNLPDKRYYWAAIPWRLPILDLYNFCKKASNSSATWAEVYRRTLIEVKAWAMYAIKSEHRKPACNNLIRFCYVDRLLVTTQFDHANCLAEMILDALKNCDSIDRMRHNSAIFDSFLEALWGLYPENASSSVVFSPDPRIWRVGATLLDLSERTAYLDSLIPYIKMVCHANLVRIGRLVATFMSRIDAEKLAEAILRYEEKPVPEDYDNDFRLGVDFKVLSANRISDDDFDLRNILNSPDNLDLGDGLELHDGGDEPSEMGITILPRAVAHANLPYRFHIFV